MVWPCCVVWLLHKAIQMLKSHMDWQVLNTKEIMLIGTENAKIYTALYQIRTYITCIYSMGGGGRLAYSTWKIHIYHYIYMYVYALSSST